jgi:hypothetical protein
MIRRKRTTYRMLIDAEDCDADFEIHQFERAGR